MSCENDFPPPSFSRRTLLVLTLHLSSHTAGFVPLMFSLRRTDILTALQKHSVAPMFVCLAGGRLRLRSGACAKRGGEGAKPENPAFNKCLVL